MQIDDRISKGTSVLLLETEVDDPEDLDSANGAWTGATEPTLSQLEESHADEFDGRIEPTLGYAAEGRRRMVQLVCGKVDGLAGARIAEKLLSLATRSSSHGKVSHG